MADEIPRLVPTGALTDQPIYSDAHVVQDLGDTITVWFMRVPPTFTEAQLAKRAHDHPGEVHGQTIAAVTMVSELAEKLAESILKLVKKPSAEG